MTKVKRCLFCGEPKGLREELEREKTYAQLYKAEVERLKARVKELESGRKCRGRWCRFCVHVGVEETRQENGRLIMAEHACLKEVPCQDYERRIDL